MQYHGSSLKRSLLGLGLGAVAALVLACGGGDDDPSPTATTGSGGAAGTTPTAGATTSAGTTPTTSATSSTGTTPAQASLSDLKSYRYTIEMSGVGGPMSEAASELEGLVDDTTNIKVEGAFVSPDKAETKINFGGLEVATTIIGNQQWVQFAGQVVGPQPATSSDLASANFMNDFWSDGDFGSSLEEFDCGSKETVNTISATKCTLDKAGFEKLRAKNTDFMDGVDVSSLTSSSGIQIWVADAGFPVRMLMDIVGKDDTGGDVDLDVVMNLTDVNGNINIEAP